MISNVEELRAEVRCSLANAEWRIPFLETRGYITRRKKDIGRAENSVSISLGALLTNLIRSRDHLHSEIYELYTGFFHLFWLRT